MLNKKILGFTVIAALAGGTAQASMVQVVDTFGVFGSASDPDMVLADVTDRALSVASFASTAEGMAGNVLTNVKVEIRASMSTKGTFTNNGSSATVNATVLELDAPWIAEESGSSVIGDHVFGDAYTTVIDEFIGSVSAGATGSFGTFTHDSDWLTVYDDSTLNSFFNDHELMYLFSTKTSSFISGSSNFASSFTTATAGGLRVTYSYQSLSSTPIPEPAVLVLMGFGLLGFACRKQA